MNKIFKNSIILFIITALTVIPCGASSMAQDQFGKEESPDAAAIAFDVLLIRPFGIGSILAGSFIFAVAFPFSYLTGKTKMTYEKLIKDPAHYTFKRPVGTF